MGKNRGQTSIEFLVLLAVTLLVLTVAISISFENMTDVSQLKERNDANNAVMDLSGAAKEVYAQGVGARKEVYVVFPSGYSPIKSSVGNQAIRINANGNDYVEVENFKVRGSLPGTPGAHWIWVVSEGNIVRIGDALLDFDKNALFLVMNENSTQSAQFTVTNIWTSGVNVTASRAWTAGQVSFSGVPSSFSLSPNSSQNINLQFTSGVNSTGFYSGEIDFTAQDGSGFSELDVMPITVEVVPVGQQNFLKWDVSGPPINKIWQSPTPATVGHAVAFYVNASDATTGNNSVSGCQIEADKLNQWQNMAPADGAFDSATEVAVFNYTSGFLLGPHFVSAICTDSKGNAGPEAYYYFLVNQSDTVGPMVMQMAHTQYASTLTNLTFTGIGTDQYTGGSNVSSCVVKVGDNDTWHLATPNDGTWGDNVSEPFTYNSTPLSVGTYTIYYQCNDSAGNAGGVYTDTIKVVDIDTMLVLDRSGSMAWYVTNFTDGSTMNTTNTGWTPEKTLSIGATNGDLANLSVTLNSNSSKCSAFYEVTVTDINGPQVAMNSTNSTSAVTFKSLINISSYGSSFNLVLYLKNNNTGCKATTGLMSLIQPPTKMSAVENGSDTFLYVAGNSLQAGLVSYSTTSSLDKTLAIMTPTNQQSLINAINNLNPSGSTCIQCALHTACDELTSNRSRSTANKIAVLLTDGEGNVNMTNSTQCNGVGCGMQWSIEGASYCQARNVTVYTIGFGSDVNDLELFRIAQNTSGSYYYAPDVATLLTIFKSIGRS